MTMDSSAVVAIGLLSFFERSKFERKIRVRHPHFSLGRLAHARPRRYWRARNSK
jgi:hypothetical protein